MKHASMLTLPRLGVLLAVLATGVALSCSAPPVDSRTTEALPDRATFPPVADLLVKRCGTLDCHGSAQRNLRLYGNIGLRLDPSDKPVSQGQTTEAEYDEDYASVVGLEPEVMTNVVNQGGAEPDRLTLVRKARGAEHHKGNTLWQDGDPQDRCITSWLAGQTDVSDCVSAKDSSF